MQSMSNVEFKLPKFKMEIDPYLKEQIICHAMLLGLYDPNFEEKDQCSGFFAFKELVVSELMPHEHISVEGKFILYAAQPAYALLNQLHPLTRKPALSSAYALQSMAKSLRTTKNQL